MERRKEPIVNTKQWEAKDSEADFLSFGEETWKKVTYEAKSEKQEQILIHSVRYSLNPTQAAEILTKHNFRKEGDEEEKGEQKKMMRPWKTRTESRKWRMVSSIHQSLSGPTRPPYQLGPHRPHELLSSEVWMFFDFPFDKLNKIRNVLVTIFKLQHLQLFGPQKLWCTLILSESMPSSIIETFLFPCAFTSLL